MTKQKVDPEIIKAIATDMFNVFLKCYRPLIVMEGGVDKASNDIAKHITTIGSIASVISAALISIVYLDLPESMREGFYQTYSKTTLSNLAEIMKDEEKIKKWIAKMLSDTCE